MPKQKTVFTCNQCGYEVGRWLGRCPSCSTYNSFEESVKSAARAPTAVSERATPVSLAALDEAKKFSTGIGELDRVLSGGIVPGSLILLGGEPGIGKSTILLQMCLNQNFPILYVSGEESAGQISLRARRLGRFGDSLLLYAQTSLIAIEEEVRRTSPRLLIIDSIQTMAHPELTSAPGAVTQVRECTALLLRLSKQLGIATIIVGHVTKEGAIAGPRILEHMVDCVLYFEGERHANYRIIRAVKNRFGATNEIGVFEMTEGGLAAIKNPSEYMLAGRPAGAPGSVVTCAAEGSRPILAEVQALVARTRAPNPRRVVSGMDYNRVNMLLAMLEKRCGLNLSEADAYINVAGGLKLAEPAADLAAIAAIAGSYKNKATNPHALIFGEAGLTGEARAVSNAQRRIDEGAKLGFNESIIPRANTKGLKPPEGMKIYGVNSIKELLDLTL